jgi:hypothetical protein
MQSTDERAARCSPGGRAQCRTPATAPGCNRDLPWQACIARYDRPGTLFFLDLMGWTLPPGWAVNWSSHSSIGGCHEARRCT